MASSQFNSKGVQTDANLGRNSSKFFSTLQRYITAVSHYRLYLFNQYTQSIDAYEHEELLNVRKDILQRFQSVINELEQTLGYLQRYRLTDVDVLEILNRPLVKEVIEVSLKANVSSSPRRSPKQLIPNIDEWRIYRDTLQETREDLHIMNFLVHRGISKIDRLVNVTSLYV